MEILYCSTVLVLIITIVSVVKHLRRNKNQLPPSPPALPILGHFHLLKGPQHRCLKSLSDKYGPIIYLRFGNRPTVVVSSASAAEECFTKNDIVLANRPQFVLSKIFSYNNTSISFSPYGEHWRNLRRVSTIHIFSSLSLQHSSAIRAEEIILNVKKMFSSSKADTWKEINLTSFFQDLVQNVIMQMVCGKRWSTTGDVFKQIVSLAGASDYIPILRWISFGGAKKKAINLHNQTDKFLQELIDDYRRSGKSSCSADRKTIVQAFLSLQEAEPEYYTDNMIKVGIQSMFTAGTDTSVLTMQWAMAHLLNHPEVLGKARDEIDKNIKPGHLIEDSDLPELPYLRCIISETLRLCPAAPLLLPHFSSGDCTINGYKIPRGTTFLINAWAIHRDPNLWEEPTKFKPERFEGIEAGSEGFKYLPFGKGRRSCPGNNLALRFVGLALGSLIQCFEWKRLGSEMVDLDEKDGLTMRKVKPLRGLYRPRQATLELLSQLRVDYNLLLVLDYIVEHGGSVLHCINLDYHRSLGSETFSAKQESIATKSTSYSNFRSSLSLERSTTPGSQISLCDKYGPIIYLRFGNRPTVVVSSASVAEECFTKNDVVLANRPQSLVAKTISYNNTSLSFSPYGEHWRNLRRVTTIHIFSSLSLQHSAAVRSEEVRFNVQSIFSRNYSETWKELNLTSFFQDLVQNVIMRMVCGKRWCTSADAFKQFVALSNTSDYFPILKWIGLDGTKRKAISLHKQTNKFLQDIIDEGRRNRSSSYSIDKQRKTILQAYLSLQEAEPEYYTDNMIKVMMQFMFIAGIDTSVLTMQWAMSHLLNHPEALEKAREEIDKNITSGHLIEDLDLPELPYLRCIISETLRLCPAAPLLLPHFSSEDCTINGYRIPRGTTFLINAWAIHRDPNLWEEPTEFKPERFEEIEVGCEGFRFLPFGKGRRSCPGNNLAMRFVGLALGTLIQCFEWKRLGTEMVDLDEKDGLTMRKAKPLKGLYRPRRETAHLLSQHPIDH